MSEPEGWLSSDFDQYLRVYEYAGVDGYPPEWHRFPDWHFGIKHFVRTNANHRCVRCWHHYTNGKHGNGEWSPCDYLCTHGGPARVQLGNENFRSWDVLERQARDVWLQQGFKVEALWRILTVHHLNGCKLDCRWWNLAALCQRCHLSIQSRVIMDRPWTRPHTPWFQPYVAAYYAHTKLGEDLTRFETMQRLDELLALEDQQQSLIDP